MTLLQLYSLYDVCRGKIMRDDKVESCRGGRSLFGGTIRAFDEETEENYENPQSVYREYNPKI
jgi:hypothetical protein